MPTEPRPPAPAARTRWFYGALVAGLCGGSAEAGLKLDTHLSAQGEYDTNVFRVSRAVAEQDLGTGKRADYRLDSQLGEAVEYTFDDQRLYAAGDVDRIVYKRLSELDHNEYDWLGGMDWKLGGAVDGGIQYKQARRMVPEENRATPSTSLDFEQDKNGSASANFNVAPQWRVQTRADFTSQDSPSPDAYFHYDETAYTAGFKYLGLGALDMGLQGAYHTGNYIDAIQAGPYRQVDLDYTLNYKAGSASQLSLLLGGSQRHGRDGASESFSGFTGELDYKRQLSGKTALGLDLYRRVQSYAVTGDTVAQTGLAFNADWQATAKIFVNLLASYEDDAFKQSSRDDKLALLELGLSYQPLNWLSLKPTVQYENRQSNETLYSFADTVVGIEAKVKF
jgi:hypothetical protein